MALSKLEIQQMLREMNVKFDADETYAELKHRLQQENHSLWLKSVAGNRTAEGAGKRVVVRKRRKASPDTEPTDDRDGLSNQKATNGKRFRGDTFDHAQNNKPAYRSRPIEKPSPGQHWKPAAEGTEPFNRTKNVFDSVLKRAKNCCERCGAKSDEGVDAFELKPYYIQGLAEGGEHSIKNMVALCPACHQAIEADPSAKDIKELKRRTRSRLYDALQVVRKKRSAKRRHSPPTD